MCSVIFCRNLNPDKNGHQGESSRLYAVCWGRCTGSYTGAVSALLLSSPRPHSGAPRGEGQAAAPASSVMCPPSPLPRFPHAMIFLPTSLQLMRRDECSVSIISKVHFRTIVEWWLAAPTLVQLPCQHCYGMSGIAGCVAAVGEGEASLHRRIVSGYSFHYLLSLCR